MDNKGMADLHRAREEVISEVMKAPARRVDNAITRLGDGVGLLRVHANVQKSAMDQHSQVKWRGRAEVAALTIATACAAGGTVFAGAPQVGAPLGAVGGVAAVALGVWNGRKVRGERREASERRRLN